MDEMDPAPQLHGHTAMAVQQILAQKQDALMLQPLYCIHQT